MAASSSQKLIFVTGKGGVGKSTVAAALALKASRKSATLLAEIGDQSYFQEFFDQVLKKPVQYEPQGVLKNFHLALWSGQECLKEYAKYLLKIESLYKLFFENAIMKTFLNVAPGLPELSIMGKMTSGVRKHGPPMPYETLVMDSFATGHFLALLRAPVSLSKAIKFGPMGEQSRSIDLVLKNPSISEYVVVCLPEELPTKETIELCQDLKTELGFSPRVILNRCLLDDETEESISKFAFSFPQMKDFADYLLLQKQKQDASLSRLKDSVEHLQVLPFIFENDPVRLIEKMAEKL